MANESQIIYEYTNGNTVEIKTNDLSIDMQRLYVNVVARPDGKIYVDDPGIVQRVFTGTGTIVGADANELHDVQNASITFDGTYPRIQTITWKSGTTETNISVTGHFVFGDLGSEFWSVKYTLTEYTD